jgi:hypothetical protein
MPPIPYKIGVQLNEAAQPSYKLTAAKDWLSLVSLERHSPIHGTNKDKSIVKLHVTADNYLLLFWMISELKN